MAFVWAAMHGEPCHTHKFCGAAFDETPKTSQPGFRVPPSLANINGTATTKLLRLVAIGCTCVAEAVTHNCLLPVTSVSDLGHEYVKEFDSALITRVQLGIDTTHDCGQ